MERLQNKLTRPIWEIKVREKKFPTLKKDIRVDTAIIGGGITGITSALELVKDGQEVAVIEALTIGSGTTGHSTGNLYIPVQPFYSRMHKDEETIKQIVQARAAAINYIEETVQEHEVHCHFSRRPFYFYTNQSEEKKALEDELQALKKAGLQIKLTSEMDLPVPYKKAALLENQARFNPFIYVEELAQVLARLGCEVYEHTPVEKIEEFESGCRIYTPSGIVEAKKVIMATHTPKGIDSTQMKEAPYRSYVISVSLQDKNYPLGHYWDLDNPHYITSTHAINGNKINSLMVAGNHHKTGQGTEDYFHDLMQYIERHYPVQSIDHQWSAQHYQTADKIPYIGAKGKHTYIATGYFADGLTYGTLAGKLIADLIVGRTTKLNKLAKIFDPTRHNSLAAVPSLIKENVNVACQYMKDFPGAGTISDVSELNPDSGGVVEVKGEKYAVYKDSKSKLHIVSAVCTHMKCIVNWNTGEKTWDCPCHGSRFSVEGEVIEGPALQNLEKFNSLKE